MSPGWRQPSPAPLVSKGDNVLPTAFACAPGGLGRGGWSEEAVTRLRMWRRIRSSAGRVSVARSTTSASARRMRGLSAAPATEGQRTPAGRRVRSHVWAEVEYDDPASGFPGVTRTAPIIGWPGRTGV